MATMAQAKRDFQLGYLTAYQVKRWDLASGGCPGWFVWLGQGNAAGWLVDARSHDPRQFKTLDAAIQALEQIGFKVDALVAG